MHLYLGLKPLTEAKYGSSPAGATLVNPKHMDSLITPNFIDEPSQVALTSDIDYSQLQAELDNWKKLNLSHLGPNLPDRHYGLYHNSD